jgi:hypothetical protein
MAASSIPSCPEFDVKIAAWMGARINRSKSVIAGSSSITSIFTNELHAFLSYYQAETHVFTFQMLYKSGGGSNGSFKGPSVFQWSVENGESGA